MPGHLSSGGESPYRRIGAMVQPLGWWWGGGVVSVKMKNVFERVHGSRGYTSYGMMQFTVYISPPLTFNGKDRFRSLSLPIGQYTFN